jgi:hypothetical protein
MTMAEDLKKKEFLQKKAKLEDGSCRRPIDKIR